MVMGVCFSPPLMLRTPMVQTLIQLLFTALQAPHEVLWTPQNHELVSVSIGLPYCIVLLYGLLCTSMHCLNMDICWKGADPHKYLSVGIHFVCYGYPWISLHTSTDVM